jgi:aspartate carbamoyltransferase catalytic subunit
MEQGELLRNAEKAENFQYTSEKEEEKLIDEVFCWFFFHKQNRTKE